MNKRSSPFIWILCAILTSSSVVTSTANAAAPSINSVLAGLTNYVTVSPDATPPTIAAKAFVLINAADGTVLTGDNIHEQLPVGSTTKMVTALIADQSIKPTTVLTVPADAAAIEGSKVGLPAGQQMTFANMLKGLLIPSGNDVAYTLADYFSKTPADYQPFIMKMNQFIKNYHLQNTKFADPAGLNDAGYSSVFDLAQIGRLVLNDPTLASVVATPSTTITATNSQTYSIVNTNQLLQSTSPAYNPNVIGIKTGSTPIAGYCLVAAEKFHNQLLIGVVLGVPGNNELVSATQMENIFQWADQQLSVTHY